MIIISKELRTMNVLTVCLILLQCTLSWVSISTQENHTNPTQEITYLGFVLNAMSIKLTTEKASTIKIECESALQVRKITITQVARILGLLVSCFPGVMWGPLHNRQLESDKTEALKIAKVTSMRSCKSQRLQKRT